MAWYDSINVNPQGIFDPGHFTYGEQAVPNQYQDRDKILALINQGYGQGGVTNYQAPQLQMGNDPFRQAQLQQLAQLQRVAGGQQQGAAELATQRQYANALAAQQGLARSVRGGNAALAYRNAANQSAALGSSAAGMGQQAALADQQAAQGMLGQVGAQGRQADIGVANANAGYQQGANQLNSQNYMGLLSQLGGMDAGQLGIAQQAAQAYNQNLAQRQGGSLGGIGQIIGASMSDERVKDNVVDARKDIDEMLDALRPVGWQYKDPKHGEGHYTGIIAQDMERSRAGRDIVRETPDGKALDNQKLLNANTAAVARLNERLRELEGKSR